jgi:hypothetical protein
MVPIEPSCPEFIALSMSRASGPRTSPTMIRCGRIRSAWRTSSRIRTSPTPSRLAKRLSNPTQSSRWRCRASSLVSSMVTTRCPAGIWLATAFRVVVLPDPVPPEISRFNPARTAAASSRATSGVRVPSASRSSMEWASSRWRRIVRQVNGASGGQITCSRLPSGNLASALGLASSSRRPATATVRAANARSSASDPNPVGTRSLVPPAWTTNARWWPLTRSSSTSSPARWRSSGPSPSSASNTILATRCCWCWSRGMLPARTWWRWASASRSLITAHTRARSSSEGVNSRAGPSRRASSAAAAPRTLATNPSGIEAVRGSTGSS